MSDSAPTSAPAPATGSGPAGAIKSFFTALFDFSFKSFVSRRLAGIFYGVALALTALGGIIWFFTLVGGGVATLANGGNGAIFGVLIILGAFIIVPVGLFVAVLLLRVWIEAIVALIAVAENTASLRK
ncbi:MAG: DUF4282 domain-containing protein [Microcella sp.]|uniref:DUF4282 domain-containing protein n=1 Tax=Microcella sp. TaxID=1913979 RepID=UPI00331522BD